MGDHVAPRVNVQEWSPDQLDYWGEEIAREQAKRSGAAMSPTVNQSGPDPVAQLVDVTTRIFHYHRLTDEANAKLDDTTMYSKITVQLAQALHSLFGVHHHNVEVHKVLNAAGVTT